MNDSWLRTAALVDVENLLFVDGRRVSTEVAAGAIELVRELTPGLPVRTALSFPVLEWVMPLLAGTGWGITPVPPAPDAADHSLLEAAASFAESGYTDLVVVSGDHVFSALAGTTRLHIVSYGDRLSRQLSAAASTLRILTPPTLPAAA